MFKKTLLATSALVVASSVALAAGQHSKLSHAQQQAKAKQAGQHAMAAHMPGVIFDRKHNTPVAVRFQMSQAKAGAHGVPGKVIPGAKYSTLSKQPNARFLSFFGWFAGATSISYNSSYSYCISYNSNYTQCLRSEHIHDISQINLAQSAAQPFTGVSSVKTVQLGANQYSGTGGAKVSIYTDAGGVPGTKVGNSGSFSTAPSFNGLCCAGLQTVKVKAGTLSSGSQYWVVLSGNSGANGRVAWNGQNADFSAFPTGEDYNANEHVYYSVSEHTSSGYSTQYSGSYSSGTGGWVHTSSFSFQEQQAGFAVK